MSKTRNSLRVQILRRSLLGFILAPTILIWLLVLSSYFFGYRVLATWGISMEPTIHNGDALWVKELDATDVKVGDIVSIFPLGDEAITHRVVIIESLSQGNYLLTTKGDANHFTECCKNLNIK